MHKTSSNFNIACFRHRLVTCLLLTIFSFSFLPSVSMAKQPTATVKTLSGTVLVSGQAATVGTILQAGETIETQAGASVVLELSDGSELHLSENTQINLDDLSQTATGARVSRVKLLWGRIRAFLSPQHQIEGSSFNIETPNALIGVKFSEPDVEVSYSLEKAETVGIAHTVELLAKNLLTNEDVLVPVGSTVIIVGTTVKVVAGMLAIAGTTETGTAGTGATEAATTGTGATSAGTSSTGASGMGTGTKVALGVGAAAAAGVAALAASSGDGGSSDSDDSCTTAECTGDLSGFWFFTGSCVAEGCTKDTPCMSDPPFLCGTDICDYCLAESAVPYVTQSDNMLSASGAFENRVTYTLNGFVDGRSVSFTTLRFGGLPVGTDSHINTYTGTLDGNTIRGNFSGSVSWNASSGRTETATWSGTFTVTIRKE